MSTSDQAKQLLADYFRSMPYTDMGAYDSTLEDATEDEEQLSAWKLATNPKKWKRLTKYKDIEGMISGSYETLEAQVLNSKSEYEPVRLPREDFVLFREFVCAEDRLGTSLRYLVLEDKQGKLFVGENIGD